MWKLSRLDLNWSGHYSNTFQLATLATWLKLNTIIFLVICLAFYFHHVLAILKERVKKNAEKNASEMEEREREKCWQWVLHSHFYLRSITSLANQVRSTMSLPHFVFNSPDNLHLERKSIMCRLNGKCDKNVLVFTVILRFIFVFS